MSFDRAGFIHNQRSRIIKKIVKINLFVSFSMVLQYFFHLYFFYKTITNLKKSDLSCLKKFNGNEKIHKNCDVLFRDHHH